MPDIAIHIHSTERRTDWKLKPYALKSRLDLEGTCSAGRWRGATKPTLGCEEGDRNLCKVADTVEFSLYHSTAMKEDVGFENLFDFL